MENENSQVATQQSNKPVTALSKFNSLLSSQSIKAKFEEVLGKKAPMFVSNLTTIMSGSAELQKCEHMSIVSSALMAASMDLPLTPGLGFAGIVPYFDGKAQMMKAQFQVMKKGYIQLAQRTGQFKIINVSEVYEGELKSHNRFTGEYVFDEKGKISDKIIGYVSYFRLVNGFEKFLYMPMDKLDTHAKRYSKSFQAGKGKWADKQDGGYEQMCEKTVLKLNLSTYAPLSVDVNMMNAIIYDQAEIRDVEAKDFDYPDNENSKPVDTKEVYDMGDNKTLTVNQKSTEKSEAISQSVVNKVDKQNGTHKQPIQDAEVVTDQEPPAILNWWEGNVLTNMKAGIYDFAKQILPEAKYRLLEVVPQRKSNALYREALLIFHNGGLPELDKWLTKALGAKNNDSDVQQGNNTTSEEIVPPEIENEEKKDDLDMLNTKPGGMSTTEATKSFEAQRSVSQPAGAQQGSMFSNQEGAEDFKIPSIDQVTGERSFPDVYKLRSHLIKLGMKDSDVEGGLEKFCKKASNEMVQEEINVAIQKSM